MLSGSTYHASDGAAHERFVGRWTALPAPPLLDFAQFPSEGALLDLGTRRRIEDAVRRAYCCGAPDGERSLTATA